MFKKRSAPVIDFLAIFTNSYGDLGSISHIFKRKQQKGYDILDSNINNYCSTRPFKKWFLPIKFLRKKRSGRFAPRMRLNFNTNAPI